MSEQDEFGAQDEERQEREERTPAEWAKFRKEQKARKDAEGEALSAKRELAFLKAGIDTEDKQMKYFVSGYDGDLTPEAIKAKAVEVGFITLDQPSPEEQAEAAKNQQALTAQDAITRIAGGGTDIGNIPGEVALEAAFEKGGLEAMYQEAERQGLRVIRGQ